MLVWRSHANRITCKIQVSSWTFLAYHDWTTCRISATYFWIIQQIDSIVNHVHEGEGCIMDRRLYPLPCPFPQAQQGELKIPHLEGILHPWPHAAGWMCRVGFQYEIRWVVFGSRPSWVRKRMEEGNWGRGRWKALLTKSRGWSALSRPRSQQLK